MKLVFLVDLPSLLAVIPINLVLLLPLWFLHLGCYWISYLSAGIWLFGASAQWLLVGRSVEHRLVSTKWGKKWRKQFDCVCVIFAALILAGSMILIPIVNERSRAPGFRHSGISFY